VVLTLASAADPANSSRATMAKFVTLVTGRDGALCLLFHRPSVPSLVRAPVHVPTRADPSRFVVPGELRLPLGVRAKAARTVPAHRVANLPTAQSAQSAFRPPPRKKLTGEASCVLMHLPSRPVNPTKALRHPLRRPLLLQLSPLEGQSCSSPSGLSLRQPIPLLLLPLPLIPKPARSAPRVRSTQPPGSVRLRRGV
jgi:hypothetical protein